MPSFRRLYPLHSTIHNLDGAYQRQQLSIILAAAQAAEDEVKSMQDIARGLLGQGFYASVSDDNATAFNSQAEWTLAHYGKGAQPLIDRDAVRRKHCFGCGGDHSWMKDKKVNCPRAFDPAITKQAAENYKKYLQRVKELREKHKRGCVADYKDMNPDNQKRIHNAVLAIHGQSSVASSVTSTSTTGSILPGPVVFMLQVPDFTTTVLSAAAPARRILPVPIQTCFPHIILQLGQVLGCSKCPAIRCVVDTAAAINTGNLYYFAAIAKAFPHAIAVIYSTADHNPIILSGIVQQGGSSITTDLTVAFQFHMPYLTREGTNTTFLVACGPNVTVNCILGLPFIQATRMVIDAADNVANLRALDTPPFPIDMRRAMCTEPAVGAILDDNTTARYANTIAAVTACWPFTQPAALRSRSLPASYAPQRERRPSNLIILVLTMDPSSLLGQRLTPKQLMTLMCLSFMRSLPQRESRHARVTISAAMTVVVVRCCFTCYADGLFTLQALIYI